MLICKTYVVKFIIFLTSLLLFCFVIKKKKKKPISYNRTKKKKSEIVLLNEGFLVLLDMNNINIKAYASKIRISLLF